MFGTAQRIGLGDSVLTEDTYCSTETEEELEQLFNAGMNNCRDKEDKEEASQQDRKDEDENQTNDTSEETVEKKDNKKVYCSIQFNLFHFPMIHYMVVNQYGCRNSQEIHLYIQSYKYLLNTV